MVERRTSETTPQRPTEPDAPARAALRDLTRAEANLREVMRAHIHGRAGMDLVAEATKAVQSARIKFEQVRGPETRDAGGKSWGSH